MDREGDIETQDDDAGELMGMEEHQLPSRQLLQILFYFILFFFRSWPRKGQERASDGPREEDRRAGFGHCSWG